MLTISIPTTDMPLLDEDGCNVTINGKPTVLRREGEYLCYEENRCKILDQHNSGDMMQFTAASDGAEDERHVITFLDEFLKLHSGEANAEAPHLAVPLYMPLAPLMSFDEALCAVNKDDELYRKATEGKVELIAVAHGLMCEGERREPLHLILYKDRQGYWTLGTTDGLVEMAVLIDGDGRRYLSGRQLPRDEVVRRWMAGFLNWNCNCPGLYRLRYAMIEPPAKNRSASEATSE